MVPYTLSKPLAGLSLSHKDGLIVSKEEVLGLGFHLRPVLTPGTQKHCSFVE